MRYRGTGETWQEGLGSHFTYWLFALAALSVAAASSISNPWVTFFGLSLVFGALLVFSRPDLGVWLVVALSPIETVLNVDFFVTKAVKLGLASLIAVSLVAN